MRNESKRKEDVASKTRANDTLSRNDIEYGEISQVASVLNQSRQIYPSRPKSSRNHIRSRGEESMIQTITKSHPLGYYCEEHDRWHWNGTFQAEEVRLEE